MFNMEFSSEVSSYLYEKRNVIRFWTKQAEIIEINNTTVSVMFNSTCIF